MYSRTEQKNAASKLAKIVAAIWFFNQQLRAQAACFESKAGHDYSLHCATGEAEMLTKLQQECDIYKDGLDDCARFFVKTLDFCHGFFIQSNQSDPQCMLSYHNDMAPIDPCIERVVQNTCANRYGTISDVFITIGIVVGLVFLACTLGSVVCCRYKNSNKANNQTASAATPLLNDTETKSDYSSIGTSEKRESSSPQPYSTVQPEASAPEYESDLDSEGETSSPDENYGSNTNHT